MIAENFAKVKEKIEAASARRRQKGESAENVTLIAVTKNHDVKAMLEAITAGASVVGENRVQEAKEKFAAINEAAPKIRWHLIGHLQTNKAAAAVNMFDLIHSVDSDHLLAAIDKNAAKIGKVQDILLQVNLAQEESKFGLAEKDLFPTVEKASRLENIRLMGLMCIAPNYPEAEMARPLFRRMREIFLKAKDLSLPSANIKYLSMGMTNDYEIAVEEGANLVRVGTAIFGQRQY